MKKNQVFFTLLMILAIGAGNMQAATAKWYSNGAEIASQDAEAGTALNIPASPADEFAGGYIFAGWTTEPIVGKAAVAPTLVNTTGLQMPENDINYYAVFGREEQKTVIANPNDDGSIELPAATNIADRVGLDKEQWSLITVNGYQNTKVTLFNNPEKGGKYIAFNSQSQGGASMTITAPSTIESVRFSFTGEDYSQVWVKVNNQEVVATNGKYAINANAFTIGAKNDATKQVRITQIDVILASASYATSFVKANPEIFWSSYDTEIILLGYSATPAVRSIVNPHNLPVRYRSGDSSVMEVNPTTGVITPKAMGYASMFVVFDGNEEYAAGDASYPVRVYGYDHIELSGEATKTAYEAGEAFSRAGIVANAVYVLTNQANRNLNVTDMAEWSVSPTYVTEDGNIAVTAIWQEKTSEAVDVAVTLNKHAVTFEAPENGTLVIKNGETPIASGDVFVKGTTLTVEATPASADYKAGVVTVTGATLEGNTITVGTTDFTVAASFAEKADPEISWSATEATYIHGEVNELPTLTNDPQLVITFESTDESVATVDQEGNVTPLEVTGTTTIKAIFAGNDDYKAKTVSYTLNVTYNAPVVKLAGDFTEWETGALTLTPNEKYTEASVQVAFGADAWPQFKIVVDDTWRGLPKQNDKYYLFHRDWTSAVVAGAGENMQLHTDYAGEYTFTWTYATNTLKITFPAIPEIEYYIAGSFTSWESNRVKMTEDNGAYVAEITISSTGNQEFKVVRDQGGIKTWYGLANNATMTSSDCENWTIGGGDKNIGLQPTKAGDYKFVFTPGEEPKLTVDYPAGSGTGVDEVQGDNVQSTKVLRGNQIFILRGNKTYTIDGQMVK